MKKITSILLAIVIAACTAVSASAAGLSTRTTLGRLKSVTTDNEVSVLSKSVSISQTLDIADGELLAIPSGKTLFLKSGANIDGDIYVENGGKIIFSDGEVTINGSLVSDGTVTIKSAASALVYGNIYVSSQGTLSIGSDEKVAVSESGKIVCMGKTNSKLLDIATKPIAAVLKSTDIAGRAIKTEAMTDNFESVIPDPNKYYAESETPTGGVTSTLYMFFDNGVCISAGKIGSQANSENYSSICGVSVRNAKIAINALFDTV